MMMKKKKMNRKIDKKTGVVYESDTTVSIPMSDFPVVMWDDWDEDCKKHYKNIRWQKAYSDHLKAKQLVALLSVGAQFTMEKNTTAPEKEKEEGLGLLSGEE